jgi:AcrR family transcriptional regulator
MGYKHSREEFLDAAVSIALSEGLSRVTYSRVGERLSVADRSVVYYFPTKNDLITATLFTLGAQLQDLIQHALGSEPLPAHDLAKRAWPVLATPDADPLFKVFFELVGLASASVDPYRDLAPQLMDQWVSWIASQLDEPEPTRHGVALRVTAQLDGLLLIRNTMGADAAEQAARAADLCS